MRTILYKLPSNEKVLYNLGILLEKLCFLKKKIGVFCDKDNISLIDKTLWTFSTNYFVPHDISVNDVENEEKERMFDNNEQPILLSTKLVDIIDREVWCVFNDIDFEKIVKFLQENKDNKNLLVKDIIYMVSEKNVDIVKINDLLNNLSNDFEDNVLDIYARDGLKWKKIER